MKTSRLLMAVMMILFLGFYGCGDDGDNEQSSSSLPVDSGGGDGGGDGGGGDVLPAAPTGVNAVSGENGKATISWSSVEGATSYNIYISTAPGVTKTSWERQTPASGSPAVITGLINETLYYFVITAVNSAGESAESAEVSATPALSGGDIIPSAPTGVNAVSGENGKVTLSWDSVEGATSYNVYISTATGVTKTNWEILNSASGSPAVITGLINETPYYFVITAVNAAGESVESAEVSATPALRWALGGYSMQHIVVAPSQDIYAGSDSNISRFDQNGILKWTYQIYDVPSASFSSLHGIAVRQNGELYISRNDAYLPTNGQTYQEFVEKLDPATGAVLWSTELSPCGSNWSPGLAVNEYGIFAANFECVAGLDFNGNILGYSYIPNLSGPGGRGGIHSIITDGTNVYVAGNTAGDSFAPNAGGHDLFLAKYDKDGNQLWAKQWGGIDFELDPSLCLDETTGSIFVANGGMVHNWGDILNSGGDMYINVSINQFDQDGNLITRQTLPETERRTVINCYGGKIYLGMGHLETKLVAMTYDGARLWTWIGPLSTYASDAIGADWTAEKLYSGGAGSTINILSTATGEKLN